MGELAGFALWFFVLPLAVVGLLLGGSPTDIIPTQSPSVGSESGRLSVGPQEARSPGARAERRNFLKPEDRRGLAKWAALIVGVAAGVWRFRSAWDLTARLAASHQWVAAGICAPWLVAAPLAILGLWRARWAAYAFAISYLVVLASPLRAAHNLGDVLGYLLFAGIPALPLALLAALLFYASRE